MREREKEAAKRVRRQVESQISCGTKKVVIHGARMLRPTKKEAYGSVRV